jgi:rod shape-determining protein MreC
VGLGRLQNQARNEGRIDGVTQMFQAVVRPGAEVVNNVATGTGDFWSGIASASRLKAENRELQALRQVASLYASRVDFLESEIRRLEKLNGVAEFPGKTKIPARVIGFFPAENRMTLSVGSNKGLKPGMPIICADGLVGIIQAVSGGQSQALLVSSPQLRIGAVINRQPAPAGLIRGESASKMILEIIDTTATIEAGDQVLTSGHSELIPGGIPIGIVAMKTAQPEYGSVRCQVFPFAQVGDIREVIVLR